MPSKKKVSDEEAVLEKIASMPEEYRAIGERLHEIIMETVPDLKPRLWYGLPGYANVAPFFASSTRSSI